jgi:hypothetical protein
MRPIRSLLALTVLAHACGGEPKKTDAEGPQPRDGDPALEHTWTMPAESSALSSGDLGSTPPQLAVALMDAGRMPSIAHQITQACVAADALGGVDEVALRFSIAEGAKVAGVQPDPSDRAGTCLAEGLRQKLDEMAGELPAGAALLRIRLHRAG